MSFAGNLTETGAKSAEKVDSQEQSTAANKLILMLLIISKRISFS